MRLETAVFEPQTDSPFEQFRIWLAEAEASEVEDDVNVMTLATADSSGRPSARIVLMKKYNENGIVFYTNTKSQKGLELAMNPFGALLFYWRSIRSQVRFDGPVVPVSTDEADEYYATRPRNSKIAAWASKQSLPLSNRGTLMQAFDYFDNKYSNALVPRPPYWSGYRLSPRRVEFWRDKQFRLHDRFVFARKAESFPWKLQRLFP
ncbi:pyridoxamine 5'-phosphate oxidase [Candidatus Endolissoclinum faulkneri L2]|uniref:Pyridoxine/pyridoxamine 5'-phosphate oxidase n=1 Tax=Candidatus Endolissoclinum faulkneri L2 TaxID=1193729 RepID=K7YMJ4_9PROT|nr:pyridoxamine 5'-phosphate oxidase [Candidatus Endolissoclinum faulkneri]AFX98742.1 pyridoxamine 5'-phosphate oxidase [Candidatus Endolissoclinum faulkneri L2]